MRVVLLLCGLAAVSLAADVRTDDAGEGTNTSATALGREADSVWNTPVTAGDSDQMERCRELLKGDLGDLAPAPAPGCGGHAGSADDTGAYGPFHQQGKYLPALLVFSVAFLSIVGSAKFITNNVLAKGGDALQPALTTMYAEASVFLLIAVLGYLIIRSGLLSAHSRDTLSVLFDNAETMVFYFVVCYLFLCLSITGGMLKVSSMWRKYEHANIRSEEQRESANGRSANGRCCCGMYTSKAGAKQRYMQLRTDFMRNSLGHMGVRGRERLAAFDFSRYLSLQLGKQTRRIFKVTLPQWIILLVLTMFACLVGTLPLSTQLVLSQVASWTVVVFGCVLSRHVSMIVTDKLWQRFRLAGSADNSDDNSELAEIGEGRKVSSSSKGRAPLLGVKTDINMMLSDGTRNGGTWRSVCCGADHVQHSYLWCGRKGERGMRAMQRLLLVTNGLFFALQMHLVLHATPPAFGWVFALLGFFAFFFSLHNSAQILMNYTLLSGVEFFRKWHDVDKVRVWNWRVCVCACARVCLRVLCVWPTQFQLTPPPTPPPPRLPLYSNQRD
jgi:hypothetical protein